MDKIKLIKPEKINLKDHVILKGLSGFVKENNIKN